MSRNIDTGWRWLERHAAGWAVVRIVRDESRKVVIVYDPERQDEYPAARAALCICGCKAVGYVTADEAVGIGDAR